MRAVQFTLFTLLITAHLMAQIPMQVEAESSVEPAASSIQPVSLPDAPEPQRVIDKKFIVVLGALGAAESLRISTNTLALEHMFAAGAPWVTSAPNHRNLAAKNGLIFASELIVAYELKKPHSWLPGDKVIRKLWWVYPVVMMAIHFKNASDTIRMRPPAGCTSAECQLP
ncbi:MAG: hypothetical protein WAQ52_06595 [Terriglobales bacterium]